MTNRPSFPLFIIILALALTARADDGPPKTDPAPKPPEPKQLEERTATLENGLQVVVLPSTRAKWIVCVTAFRTGARDESATETGAANLVARIVRHAACGARKPQEAEQELAALGPGMRETEPGGEAKRDITYFHATAPEEKLGAVLDVERDRFLSLAPTAELVDRERERALAEIVVDAEKPTARAFGTLLSLAYGESGIGRSHQSVATKVGALTLDALEAWRKAHLRVEDAFVIVAGARDPDAAIQVVKEKLGTIPRSKAAPAETPQVPFAKGPLKANVDGPAAFRQVLVGFRGPDPGSADEAAFLAVALHVRDVVVPALRGVARDAEGAKSVYLDDMRSSAPALLVVAADPRGPVSNAELLAKIDAAVATAKTEPPADVSKLRERLSRMLKNLTAPLDARLAKAKDEAEAIAQAAIDRALADPLVRRREGLEKQVAALTKESFLQAAGTFLSEERERVVVAEPQKGAEPKPTEEPK